MKLLFLNYLGDCRYSFRGSSNLRLKFPCCSDSIQWHEVIPLGHCQEFSAVTVAGREWLPSLKCNDVELNAGQVPTRFHAPVLFFEFRPQWHLHLHSSIHWIRFPGRVYHLSQNYYITARCFWTISFERQTVKNTSRKLCWNYFGEP